MIHVRCIACEWNERRPHWDEASALAVDHAVREKHVTVINTLGGSVWVAWKGA
jgi:hypothetical protein